MPLINWSLFDRIREFARSNRIYQQERNLQDQSAIDRVALGGEFLDFNVQSAILEQSQCAIARLERYRDYSNMDMVGEVSLALDLIADGCSLIDPEHKHSLIIRAANRKLKEELEELFYGTLLIDRWMRPAARYLCKYGDCPWEIVTDRNRTGVSSLRFMNVYNFTRIETRFGDLVGFFYQDDLYPEPLFLHPWSVMHMRLTSLENELAPYGRSGLEGGRKAWKMLRLMEDAALIYRITRSAEKRVFKIPVGTIPAKEVPEYIQAIARIFKRQRFYNPTTGTFDERYSPIVQEDDFFLPQRPDGSGPSIDTLPGAENLDQIADIEYFKKKMIAPMKIPFNRVGIGEGSGEAHDKSLAQTDADFAKALQWIQSEISLSLTKVGIIHLALRGYTVEDIKGFELALAASSAIEDLYRMETWQTRVGVMSDLKDIGWFPKEWIVTRFTDLSPDEIEELHELEDEESGGGGLGGGPSGGPGGDDLGADLGGGMEMDLGGGEDIGGDEGVGDQEENEAIGEEPPEEMEEPEESTSPDERRLLMEIKGDEKRRKRAQFVRKLYERKNRISSSFTNLMESKELDGLSRSASGTITEDSEQDDPDVIVGWSVDAKTRGEVIAEYRAMLVGDLRESADSEVTDDDIPSEIIQID